MLDRYGNVIRTGGDQDQQRADWERAADTPRNNEHYMQPGWTINEVEYPESTGQAGGPSPASDVVTREAGYAPYQSLFPYQPTNYDPTGRQYPQSRQDELASGRTAETPADRTNAWNQTRPPPELHPSETIDWRMLGHFAPTPRPGPQYGPPASPTPPPAPLPQRMPQPMPRPATNPGRPDQRPLMPPLGARPGGNQGQPGQRPPMPAPGPRPGGNAGQPGYGGARPGPGNPPAGGRGGGYGQAGGSRSGRGSSNAPARGNRGRGGGRR
jgi:hypothetical protein